MVHESEQKSLENKGLNQREGLVVETVGRKSMWEERREEERRGRKVQQWKNRNRLVGD